MNGIKFIVLFLFLILLNLPANSENKISTELVKIIDGDTIILKVDKNEFSARLIGIDCCETNETIGLISRHIWIIYLLMIFYWEQRILSLTNNDMSAELFNETYSKLYQYSQADDLIKAQHLQNVY